MITAAGLLLHARAEIDFPAGANDTDTLIGGVHYNKTTLEHFNYTLFDNQTLSNGSKCWLVQEPYAPPLLLQNGTFINHTDCYYPVDPIRERGYTGIGMACAFGIALVLILTVLAKHGRHYLPTEKRFTPIGRRWQWYWGCFVCACALISLFLNVEVDRYRVQQLPLIVTSFFWYLMCMGTTCVVWEAVRHWGSWLERQYIDPNPFALSEEDRRARVEFFLPLIFYFLTWMNFFMVIPRSWTFAQKQRYPWQTENVARVAATSVRFKIGAFFLFAAWLVICFSLWHSIKHYKPRNRGIINRGVGLVKAIPLRFLLLIPLLLSAIGYQALISFDFDYSVIKKDGPVSIIYGWGYGAQLLILIVQIAYGYASPNEDKELIRQRRVRGETLDRELGLTRKPAWWRRVKGEHIVGTFRDKLLKNVQEVGQGRGVGRRAEGDMERDIRENMESEARQDDDGINIEMSNYGRRKSHNRQEWNPRADLAGVHNMDRGDELARGSNPENQRVLDMASSLLFPDPADVERRDREAEAERIRRLAYLQEDGPPPANRDTRGRGSTSSHRPATSERSNSTATSNSINAPPTKVRSMLDI